MKTLTALFTAATLTLTAGLAQADVRVVDDRGMSDTRPLGVSLVE